MPLDRKKLRRAAELVKEGVDKGYFPGAAVAIGSKEGIHCMEHYGSRSLYLKQHVLERNTLFDMASLTKVMATTPLCIRFLEEGRLSLYDKISEYLQVPEDKKDIMILQLLTHSAGFIWHILFEEVCTSSKEVIPYILNSTLQYKPGTRVIYSDLSFILLGYILEQIGKDTLDQLCKQYIYEPLDMKSTVFCPLGKSLHNTIAATEKNPAEGAFLVGSVHDENARFLGGVAGHAGLFSTIEDTVKYAHMLIHGGKIGNKTFISKNGFQAMTRNYTRDLEEDRALGWFVKADKISAGGELASPGAFGHTGFTGTSLWVDRENDVYAVLLTNRVHPTRENTHILRFRRLFHNVILSSVE